MEDILVKFGRKVKQLRKKKKWTQQDLADKSGLHKNYIGMIERGERNPSLKNISKISEALSVKMSEMLYID